MITEELKQIVIKELGIENLSDQKAAEVMEKLEENIQRSLVLEILDLLNPQDQKELNTLIETGDNSKIQAFLEDKIPSLQSLIDAVAKSAVKEFRDLTK
ncbi:MAG TPA: hypothetical protein PLF16_01355 [Candidatus Staskawiczbacteria bacterium]|nr:hypothetical protein [Candidatus Staskawiczbacteria bacterium]